MKYSFELMAINTDMVIMPRKGHLPLRYHFVV